MTYQINTELAIGAPVAQVWDIIADFPRYPEWNPFILEVVGEVRQGASVRYRFEFPKGLRIWATAKILRFEPGHELLWAAHFLTPALFNGVHHFRVGAAPEGGALFQHGEVFSGLALPLITPILRRDGPAIYAGLNQALARRVEGPAA